MSAENPRYFVSTKNGRIFRLDGGNPDLDMLVFSKLEKRFVGNVVFSRSFDEYLRMGVLREIPEAEVALLI